MIFDKDNIIKKLFIENQNKDIVIYGAGKIGKLLEKQLLKEGINVSMFWDKNSQIIDSIDGINVIKPPLLNTNEKDIIIIIGLIDDQLSLSVYKELLSNKFSNIIYGKSQLLSIIYTTCKNELNREDSFDYNKCNSCVAHVDNDFHCDISNNNYINKYRKNQNRSSSYNDLVILPTLSLIVTNKCNLKCKGCNHLQDHYIDEERIEISPELLFSDLNRILESVDLIRRLLIVGGETFLHKDIISIIKRALTLKGVGLIEIITNGTVVPPNEELYNILKNDRIHISISDYNSKDNLRSSLLKNREYLINKLVTYDISYTLNETIEWYDLGNFEDRNYSDLERKNIYKSCCFITNDLFNGKLFKCSRSLFGTLLNKTSINKHDYVDIRKSPDPTGLRMVISSFLKKDDILSCAFCNGNNNERIPAGIQISNEGTKNESRFS